jgi:hypothetical protein
MPTLAELMSAAGLAGPENELLKAQYIEALKQKATKQPGLIESRGMNVAASPVANVASTLDQILGGQRSNELMQAMSGNLRKQQDFRTGLADDATQPGADQGRMQYMAAAGGEPGLSGVANAEEKRALTQTVAKMAADARQRAVETTGNFKLTSEVLKEQGLDRRAPKGQWSADKGGFTFDPVSQKLTTVPGDPAYAAAKNAKKSNDELEEMTPEAIEKAADYWAMRGQPPRLTNRAMGKYAAAILNRATEKYPDWSMASGEANYGANVAAKNKLTVNRALVSSFEKAAQSNMQMVEDALAKVPDAGAPFLNRPLREFQVRVMGDTTTAAFNANMEIIKREAARILSTSNASGSSQISDSDRRELAAVVDNTATVAQIRKVFGMLRQDFANRIAGIDSELKGIDERIGAKPGAAPAKKSREDLLKEYGGK